MRGALVLLVLAVTACDVQSRKNSTLPPMPQASASNPAAADPTEWTKRGDSVCPAITAPQTTGAPGTTVRPGRITKDPRDGTFACYVDATKHGPATDVEPDGTTSSGDYFFNRRGGRWTGRHRNRGLAWQGNYVNGSATGQWTYWDEAGQLQSTGAVRGESRVGMWLFWDESSSENASRFTTYAGGREFKRGIILDGKAVTSHPVCGFGFSSPRCRTIIAAGLTGRATSIDRADGGDEYSLVIDGDFIANVADGHGLGIGGGIYVGDEFARYGARLSYRYWLQYWLALEASGGLLFARQDQGGEGEDIGRHGRLSINFADQLSLGVEIEHYDHNGDGSDRFAAHGFVRIGWAVVLGAAMIGGKTGI